MKSGLLIIIAPTEYKYMKCVEKFLWDLFPRYNGNITIIPGYMTDILWHTCHNERKL